MSNVADHSLLPGICVESRARYHSVLHPRRAPHRNSLGSPTYHLRYHDHRRRPLPWWRCGTQPHDRPRPPGSQLSNPLRGHTPTRRALHILRETRAQVHLAARGVREPAARQRRARCAEPEARGRLSVGDALHPEARRDQCPRGKGAGDVCAVYAV